MKKILLTSLILLLVGFLKVSAQTGDTITVQTFTFGSPQNAWFVFPTDALRFEKIIMQYTLKCNPAQSPACGEWDTATPFFLHDHTGKSDSSLVRQPTYTVNGLAPDSISYMLTPSYLYYPTKQYRMVHTGTTSFSADTIGTGTTISTAPFGASNAVSRCQYIWKAGEMAAAGLTAGNITGLQFYVQTAGSALRNLTIRIQATTLDSLTNITSTGFTTVYTHNTQFGSAGWNPLQLTTPFNWNGTSNLLMEITYDNAQAGTDNTVASTTGLSNLGLTNSGIDRSVSFHTTGQIEVPLNADVAGIDSAATIAFWAYGTPEFQPQQGSTFEAVDANGNRIFNSHTPWTDLNVYWDAGFSGSHDRINKLATTAQTEGQWNHWAFTKNVATGSMKVYLNGVLWHNGTGKTKRMNNIKKFRIGSGYWNSASTYEGKIDEFAVFNKELSMGTIKAYMNKAIDASHPNYNDMVLYYRFNDGNYLTAADEAPGNHAPAALLNGVDNPIKKSNDLVTGFTQTTVRPNIVFEQGVYTSHLDSVVYVDSMTQAPIQIISYTDSINNPGMATDTETVWPAYYHNYLYNAAGVAIDSALVTPDATKHIAYYNWYKKFPQVIKYELAKYITPYGNGLSLGDGFTWTFDLSDYRTLLVDSVHLSAGDWRELLDVKFLMIKGTPPRDVLGIQNLWNGNLQYGVASDPIESHLQPMTVTIPTAAKNTRWKSRVTGHGMDSPENCAEFCAKKHYYKVSGTQRYEQLVWRDDCDLNPLYPQGGTWVYDRANWCPGAEVRTYDFELTPYVTPGSSVVLDHDVQPYVSGGPWNSYDVADQVVFYGAPNFTLDAAVEDVLAPSANHMWKRYNPICANPVIRIKNTGSTTLTSLKITYGINGATPSVYNWTGSLPFMQTAEVTLGSFNWSGTASDFTVTISAPNGGTDMYAANNTFKSAFAYPPTMPSKFVIFFKTNSNPDENQYTVKNAAGTVILSKSGLNANTLYIDTVSVTAGCYTFEMTDEGEDGLSFWANTGQGNGSVQFRSVNPAGVIKTFNPDFGGQIYQQFTVGLASGTNDYIFTDKTTLGVYPNPSDGHVSINIAFTERKNGTIEVVDVLGKKVYDYSFTNLTAESVEADLSHLQNGTYFVTLRSGTDLVTKKLVISRGK